MSWARSKRGNSFVWFPRCCCTDLATQLASVVMHWLGVSPNFERVGHWEQLIREANEFRFQSIPVLTRTPEEEVTRWALAAQSRVQRGQVSRGRQELTGAALAPRTAATLEALQGRRPQEATSAIPREVMDFQPTSPLQLDSKAFAMPVWLFSRPWGVNKRNAPRLFGRS